LNFGKFASVCFTLHWLVRLDRKITKMGVHPGTAGKIDDHLLEISPFILFDAELFLK